MQPTLMPPAEVSLLWIPGWIYALALIVAGTALFAYIMAKRAAPLVFSRPDVRFNRIPERIFGVLKWWLAQYKHPRYFAAGTLHILLFAGFLVLSVRTASLVVIGIFPDFVPPGFGGTLGDIYWVVKDYMATVVLIAAAGAMYRRVVVKPPRYAVPERYGKDHSWEAVFVLLMIIGLMLTESLFEASKAAFRLKAGGEALHLAPLSLPWVTRMMVEPLSLGALQTIHVASYFLHDIIFFAFLCFLPLGKHFHVITSLFNVFFMKLDKGSVKPVQWGVPEEKLDELESFGVKRFEDYTWKHMLDFYSCADCGRCSDNCPANAVGRPLSPRFISIKARDYSFEHYPLKGDFTDGPPLVGAEGSIYDEDEIWSCTTCGACEEECPVMIEYIDKIVDLRRGMVDEGNVPQSLQKPLKSLEKRGNPYGKTEKKRSEWALKDKEFKETCTVKAFENGDTAKTLFFVDSVSSYDDRIQKISQAAARVMTAAEIDFAILGKDEKDSGHEVRRFGEEMLFQTLKEENTEAILATGAGEIVTADPHAYNALIKDYAGLPPVRHISEKIAEAMVAGKLKFKEIEDKSKVYTYHDPCYLGRHNGMYDIPRNVLDAIPGINRVEMDRCKDRSFCCGGGGLMLYYEPVEDQRMGQLRVEMAKEAGATVIVTACPFCMVNMEDAIKTSGLEGQMEAIDLVELIDRHIAA